MQTSQHRSAGRRLQLRVCVAVACAAAVVAAATVPGSPVARPAEGQDAPTGTTRAGAAAAGVVAAARAGKRRPNIVVVMADDMRQDDLRFAPNVRRLFRRGGVEFRNSFSNFPLCCPARASFLTGQLARNHQVLSHNSPFGYGAFDDSRTIATTLRRSGYRTGFVGKYLNRYGQHRSLVTGKPSYTYVPRGWTRWMGAVQRPGPARPPGGTYHYTKTVYNIDGRPSGRRFHGEYQTRTMGRFARQTVGRFSRSRRPFFLYLSFVAPHHGGPPERDDPRPHTVDGRRYQYVTPAVPRSVRNSLDKRITRAPGVPPGGADPIPDDSGVPPFLRHKPLDGYDRRALREVTRQRAESIRVLDQQVAQLVTRLRREGELSRTMLVFTSDNGYFLGERRMRGGKILAHEPSLRVPFLVRGPGVPAGQRRYAPVTTVDQAATILHWGRSARRHPLPLDGHSAVAQLRDDRPWSTAVLDEAMMGHLRRQPRQDPAFPDRRGAIGIRTARWSYIRYRTGAGELYDLRADPDQLVNRYRDPGFAEERAQLDAVWRKGRRCRGSGCQVSLPPALSTDVAQTRGLTERWYATVRK